MSGVYIKGMEIPTSCRACPMKMNCDDCEGWECVCVPLHEQIGYFDDLLTDKRRDDCPLVPVPPHGDLIERDAAYDKIAEQEGGNYVDMDAVDMGLNETPTIIEAEDADHG